MVAAHISKVCSALFEPLVNLKEIRENPTRYLFGYRFYAFTALIDMKPPPGGLYIHSANEPYNEEQVLSKERVVNWLDKFGVERH
jgi:ribonuclease J